MAKIAAKNPLTGNNMDLSLKGIGSLLLGGLALWGIIATTQNAGKFLTQKVNNKYVDFQPDAISRTETKVMDQTVYIG